MYTHTFKLFANMLQDTCSQDLLNLLNSSQMQGRIPNPFCTNYGKGQGSCLKGHAWNFRWGPEHQEHEMTSQICIELLPFKVNTVSHWCLCWKSLGRLKDQITQISTELCSGTSVAVTHQGLWMWRLKHISYPIYLYKFNRNLSHLKI